LKIDPKTKNGSGVRQVLKAIERLEAQSNAKE
jgi:hypothetical protein